MGSIRLNGRSYGGSPTVTDANHLTCEDGSGNTITAQSAIQNILGDFATIESSTAASKAYAVGDYLILNGNFYKVTTAISQGDTITVGTNVIRTNVGDEFKSFEFPVRELTKAQYTALPSSQQNDGTIYLITDDDGGWEAENSTYDNTSSGLTATNVQDALDELNSNQTHQLNVMLGPLVVGGTTVQIPNFSSLSEDKVVIIYLHRYSYGVSLVVPVKVIRNGDIAGGSTLYLQDATKYYTVGVNMSGVISLISNHGSGDPYVAIVVI